MDSSEATQSEEAQLADEWSDDLCKEISSYDHFTSDVLDLEVQKNVITRFYNFYLGGKVPKGLTVTDLVFSVISIIPLHVATEFTPWSEKEYSADGTLFSLPEEDKELAKKNAECNSSQEPMRFFYYISDDIASQPDSHDAFSGNLMIEYTESQSQARESAEDINALMNVSTFNNWFGIKRKRKLPTDMPQYKPTDNNTFIACCDALLGQWNENRQARRVLKYFFGVIALTLMRGVTKSLNHIVGTLSGSKFFEDHIEYMIKYGKIDFDYCIPNRDTIAICFRTFRKRNDKTRIMLAKLVTYSGFINSMLPLRPKRVIPLWEETVRDDDNAIEGELLKWDGDDWKPLKTESPTFGMSTIDLK